MPIVSNKGISKYSGSFTDRERKHLLRRLLFGIQYEDIAANNGKSLDDMLGDLLQYSTIQSPPLNYYQNIRPDPEVPYGETWVTAKDDTNLRGLRKKSFQGWLVNAYLNDNTITEKMTLFLHSFIPIQSTINEPRYLYQNYKMLRENCLGNFKTIIKKTTLDPGMLKFLNGRNNQKNRPDENYARELQELFTLGKGYSPIYSEDDIREASKILTGYQIDTDTITYTFNPNRHNTEDKKFSSFYDNKTIVGQTGADGEKELDELLDMIFAKNEVSEYFCRKLYGFFIYYDIDDTVETNVIKPLAKILRDNNYEILPVVSALLSSEHFFDTDNYGSHIKSPIDFVTSSIKETNIALPDNSDLEVQYRVWQTFFDAMLIIGQATYEPPSVSGWQAYYQLPLMHENWISTSSIGYRNQISTGWLISSRRFGYTIFSDVIKMTETFSDPSNADKLIDDALNFLHTIPPTDGLKKHLKTILLNNGTDENLWNFVWTQYQNDKNNKDYENAVKGLLILFYKYILELAEYQLM